MKPRAICCAKTIVKDPVKTKPAVDVDVLSSIDPAVMEDSFVYVHCYFDNQSEGSLIRIWRTTFLVDAGSNAKSKLVHAENISFAPQWTMIPDFRNYSFLLIFTALPKSCKQFDLIEQIPQPGGFLVRNIHRNEQDVYHINI
ncbi:hypothetical protein [Pseudochryseolinea flava]|uniref:Uncharacterized protein n=1 Tax=Pseudochryseolinea flava TaxID=2059302 RepID=A0A364XZX9_9BACT|nr:hypothetical protein [Pseudochryseolinea flava]RAW00084.1 hypothetical protein DQQ10_16170 [Pseudochryseolinea flava]